MKAFASPRTIGRNRKRVPTGEELSDQITQMFADPESEVKTIPMNNDRQVIQAVQSILKMYNDSDSWDIKLEAVKKIMGIVKGGACNYISFVQHVIKFEPLISECILNMRSTLVKYACLLISQLSQKMCENFANTVITLIPTLFKHTQNGTQIIADSCKFALLSIAEHCQSKKVLLAILEAHVSKSAVQRRIVANALFMITSRWEQEYVVSNFKQVEKALIALLADSTSESRQFARDTLKKLSEIVPEKCQTIYSQMDMRTKTSFNSEYNGPLPAAMTVRPTKRSASVGPKKRSGQRQSVAPTQKMSFIQPSTPTFEDDGRKYLSYLKQLVLQGESSEIQADADQISKSLCASLKMDDTDMVVLAMTLLGDILSVIPDTFKKVMPGILQMLIVHSGSDIAKVKRTAEKTMNGLCDTYDHDILMESALKCESSVKLLHLVDRLLNEGRVLMTTATVRHVVKICVEVWSNIFTREDEREFAKDIIGFVHDSWGQEFSEAGKLLEENEYELLLDMELIEREDSNAEDLLASDEGEEELRQEETKEPELEEETLQEEPMPAFTEEEEHETEELPPVATLLPPVDDIPFRDEVIVHKPVGKLFTEEVLTVPPEKPVFWRIQTNEETSITIEPTTKPKREIRKLQFGATEPVDIPSCDTSKLEKQLAMNLDEATSTNKEKRLAPKKAEYTETTTPHRRKEQSESSTFEKVRKAPTKKQDPLIRRSRESVASVREKPALEKLVQRLLATDDKAPIIQQIGKLIEQEQGQGMELVLPHLIRLTKSAFSAEVERVVQLIGTFATSGSLLDTVIPLLSEPDPCVFIEFLTRVIACATKGDLTPRIRKIMFNIVPYLEHTSAEVRKHSVLCVVEMRCVMGAIFDNEINRLKNVPRKLVIHYFQKRVQ